MKHLSFLISVLVAAGLSSGCRESRAHPAHGEALHNTEAPTPAASYKPGHGVTLTEAGKAFVDVQTADVRTEEHGGKEVTVIPKDALLRTVRGDFVYVVNGNAFLRAPVVSGVADGADVQIEDGLYEGDRVVVRGVRVLALTEVQALNGGVGCADGH